MRTLAVLGLLLGLSACGERQKTVEAAKPPAPQCEAAGALACRIAPVDSLESFYKRIWTHPAPTDEVELTVRTGEEVRKVRVQAVDRMQTLRKPQGI